MESGPVQLGLATFNPIQIFVYLAVPPVPPPSEDAAKGTSTSSNLDFIVTTNVTTNSTPMTDAPIPDCFNKEKMSKLSMYQIVWWDESHQTCKLATDGNANKTQVRFKRDATGKLDPAGKLKDPHKELRVKYEK